MKQVIDRVPLPALFDRMFRLLALQARPRNKHRKGRADSLSRHTLRDIGLNDDARGCPLYGSARRRL